MYLDIILIILKTLFFCLLIGAIIGNSRCTVTIRAMCQVDIFIGSEGKYLFITLEWEQRSVLNLNGKNT